MPVCIDFPPCSTMIFETTAITTMKVDISVSDFTMKQKDVPSFRSKLQPLTSRRTSLLACSCEVDVNGRKGVLFCSTMHVSLACLTFQNGVEYEPGSSRSDVSLQGIQAAV